jgi:hypothetical protein
MNFKKLHITYCNPNNQQDCLTINYQLRNTTITKKWMQRILTAQKQGYRIDDPARFYGFGSLEQQTESALAKINRTIDHLNKWISIQYRLTSIDDQDTLNRLHHIFETEHGLLDQKVTDDEYKNCLCELNIMVHRCESVSRGAHPRHVVTYFGLPKTETLTDNDYEYFEPTVKFGTVYINYVEIGKTLFDLMLDNDSYIEHAAFQPFCHYSADFVVKFWNDSGDNLHDDLQTYYERHHVFFNSLGYTWDRLSKSVGNIPVADLDYAGDILKELETRQFVKAVDFS